MDACNSPFNFVLFFVALWAPTVICSLTLGSSGVRRRLSVVSEYQDFKYSVWRTATSIFGSLLLHVFVWNLAVAALLHDEFGHAGFLFTDLYWLWSLRPLPATLVTVITFACPALYLENALEIQLVEGLQGMLLIRYYDILRRDFGAYPGQAQDIGLKRTTDGAKVGVGFWSISVIAIMLCILSGHYFWRFWTVWSLGWNFVRSAAGFAIWGGLETLKNADGNSSAIFCPSPATLGKVAVVSIVVTIVDHIWRAIFCVGRVDWVSETLKSLISDSDKKGWPIDVTYMDPGEGNAEM
jgi:hypothetical protein